MKRPWTWICPLSSLSRAGFPLAAFTAVFLPTGVLTATPAPAISAIVNRVQSNNTTPAVDSFADYLASLPVNEGDRRGYWGNRGPQPDLITTRRIIYLALVASLGTANVSYQYFTSGGYSGVNIVGVLRGVGPAPIKQYVIGAHYDSDQNPGADDDASGVAGLLEAARVLRNYQFAGTIKFVVFDQEEERANGWGKGSRHAANLAAADGDHIEAMIGLDMIAYNHRGRNRACISRCNSRKGTPAARLAAAMAAAFQDYSGLQTNRMTGENASDPYRYYVAGFPAVLVSEEFDSDGWPFNPFYHSKWDFYLSQSGAPLMHAGRPYIDLDYASKIVRGVVGWVATEAGY